MHMDLAHRYTTGDSACRAIAMLNKDLFHYMMNLSRVFKTHSVITGSSSLTVSLCGFAIGVGVLRGFAGLFFCPYTGTPTTLKSNKKSTVTAYFPEHPLHFCLLFSCISCLEFTIKHYLVDAVLDFGRLKIFSTVYRYRRSRDSFFWTSLIV